jgi:hypothetical protein
MGDKMDEEYIVDSETIAKEFFEKQGYTVLNINERGFPDLIVLKGKEIQFLVEVKSGDSFLPYIQREYHGKLLANYGFITKLVRVKDKEVVIEEEQTWPWPKDALEKREDC